jgi:hypothetical protein
MLSLGTQGPSSSFRFPLSLDHSRIWRELRYLHITYSSDQGTAIFPRGRNERSEYRDLLGEKSLIHRICHSLAQICRLFTTLGTYEFALTITCRLHIGLPSRRTVPHTSRTCRQA